MAKATDEGAKEAAYCLAQSPPLAPPPASPHLRHPHPEGVRPRSRPDPSWPRQGRCDADLCRARHEPRGEGYGEDRLTAYGLTGSHWPKGAIQGQQAQPIRNPSCFCARTQSAVRTASVGMDRQIATRDGYEVGEETNRTGSKSRPDVRRRGHGVRLRRRVKTSPPGASRPNVAGPGMTAFSHPKP